MSVGIYVAVFCVFNFLIGMSDFRIRRVSNRTLLAALVLQGIWLMYLGVGHGYEVFMLPVATGWGQAVAGFILCLVLFYPLWRFRALGAGDVKFIAVLGFLLGPAGLFPVLLLGTVACGFHALGMVLLMGWTQARNVWRASSATRRGVPYAAYLALAAIVWMFWKVSEAGLRIV